MAIWFRETCIEDLNRRGHHTMSEFLGIQFTKITEDSLIASMPINERTLQPMGILHGGANVVLAETIASTAANVVVDSEHFYCVGLEINANHIRSATSGKVTAITSPIHLGRTTQIWEINIFNETGERTCVSRMTAAVLQRKHSK